MQGSKKSGITQRYENRCAPTERIDTRVDRRQSPGQGGLI
ncbi:hypothetical protein SABIM44S_02532 [Streptomyces abikoensis]